MMGPMLTRCGYHRSSRNARALSVRSSVSVWAWAHANHPKPPTPPTPQRYGPPTLAGGPEEQGTERRERNGRTPGGACGPARPARLGSRAHWRRPLRSQLSRAQLGGREALPAQPLNGTPGGEPPGAPKPRSEREGMGDRVMDGRGTHDDDDDDERSSMCFWVKGEIGCGEGPPQRGGLAPTRDPARSGSSAARSGQKKIWRSLDRSQDLT